ncbi:hypothetical protein [Massilia glaciei]|uniref:Uncharacterized protein n=1 Tax=Massilia glaciei TaxID=1524097 RepID=A0A2U2HDF9_9BURK|nr:hypothetical protein [Massilia glaciei]PWF40982.1 hypothetical protein C7C56_025485 [Massilia glaciei]
MSEFLLTANKLCHVARERQLMFSDDVRAFRTVYYGIVREGESLNPKNITKNDRASSPPP